MTEMASGRERETDGLMQMCDDDDESLFLEGALYKRQDFLDKEEAAKSHPNRTYYFRKPEDVDRLVELCTKKLVENPGEHLLAHFTSTALLLRTLGSGLVGATRPKMFDNE